MEAGDHITLKSAAVSGIQSEGATSNDVESFMPCTNTRSLSILSLNLTSGLVDALRGKKTFQSPSLRGLVLEDESKTYRVFAKPLQNPAFQCGPTNQGEKAM